jgi:ABC-type transport system involved in cytochrome c biogenesis ATPase subunit
MAGELLLQLLTRISWSLEGPFKDCFTYVIGNNGTGKSHLLAALADQLAYSELAPNVVCISNSLYDRFKLKGPPGYQYLGARAASNAVFRTSLDRQLFRQLLIASRKDRQRLKLLMETLGLEFEFTLTQYQLTAGRSRQPNLDETGRPAPLMSEKDVRLATSLMGDRHRFDRLSDSEIDALLNLIHLKANVAVSVRVPKGEWLKFSLLSSGELNRILLLAKVVAAIDVNTVLLIDEPEVSLHLHWQMGFHRSLRTLLRGFSNLHVVVATHSPILISEAAKVDPNSETNAVVIVERIAPLGVLSAETSVPMVPIRYATHTFSEVASHDQLVLRYFQTAPYQGREVSIEVADALLDVAEGAKPQEAIRVLQALRDAEGLDPKDRRHIDEAVQLIERGTVASVARQLEPGDGVAAQPKGN